MRRSQRRFRRLGENDNAHQRRDEMHYNPLDGIQLGHCEQSMPVTRNLLALFRFHHRDSGVYLDGPIRDELLVAKQ